LWLLDFYFFHNGESDNSRSAGNRNAVLYTAYRPVKNFGFRIFTKVINQLSLYEHYKQFVQSVISLNDIVFFLSITAMFLLLVMIVIEKRRWSQG